MDFYPSCEPFFLDSQAAASKDTAIHDQKFTWPPEDKITLRCNFKKRSVAKILQLMQSLTEFYFRTH
ncbi:unnamed protein product [Lathyrus sativus]|nr:unnamed protein product [Lathyrus sativus]